jgi:hypothetical protein
MTPGRRSLSNFILGGRGLLRILAIVAVVVAYKAKVAKPNYN